MEEVKGLTRPLPALFLKNRGTLALTCNPALGDLRLEDHHKPQNSETLSHNNAQVWWHKVLISVLRG